MAGAFRPRVSKLLFVGILIIILFDIIKGQGVGRFGRDPRQWGQRSTQGQIPRSFLRQQGQSGFRRSSAPSNPRSSGRNSFFWNDNTRRSNNFLNDPFTSTNERNNDHLQPQVIRIPAPRLSEVRVPGIQRSRIPMADSRRGPIRIVSRQNNPRQSSSFSGRSPMSSQQQQFIRNRELSRQSSPIIAHARMRQNARRLGNGLPQVMQRTSSRMTSRDYIPQVIRIPLSRFNPNSRTRSSRPQVSTRQRLSPEVQVRPREPTTITVERRPEVRQSFQTKGGLARPLPKASSQPTVTTHAQPTVDIKQLPIQTPQQSVTKIAHAQTPVNIQQLPVQTAQQPVIVPKTATEITHAQQTVNIKQLPIQTAQQTVMVPSTATQIAHAQTPVNIQQLPVQTAQQTVIVPNTQTAGVHTVQQSTLTLVQPQTVISAPAQPVQQTGSTVGTSSGTPDLIFEELVNAFTDVLQQPTVQQSNLLAPAPVVHNQHPQTVLQNSLLVAQQPMGVQPHGMLHQGHLQPQLGAGMLHQGHMMGNPMFAGPMGMMNPWMMGRMNPAMMQEMMFGDTTDPPDPVATTTAAPPTTAAPVVKVTDPVVVPVVPAAVEATVIIEAAPASTLPKAEVPNPTDPPAAEAANIPKAPVIVEAPKKTVAPIVEVPRPTSPPVVDAPIVQTPKPTAPPAVEIIVTEVPVIVAEPSVPVVTEAAPALVETASNGVVDAVGHVEVTVDVNVPPQAVKVVAEPKPAPKTMEEKIMAEVARMLLNQSVDMSLLSQVVGKVAAEMQVIEPEVAPSASLLGLTTPGPLTSGSKLSKKEKVKELIGSTRGIVFYPPTSPTLVKPTGTDTSPVVVETRPLYDVNKVNKVRFSDKMAPATIPPHADIPTLPPPKDKFISNPDIYRTLETILNHDPASIIKVMQEQTTHAPVASTPGPKISIKSLVDVGQLHNFSNLESILTDISNVKTVDLPQNITYLNSITNGTDITIVTGPVDLLTGGLESLSTSAIESLLNSTEQNLNVQPLVKSTYIPPIPSDKSNSTVAHAIQVESQTPIGSDVTTIPTDVTGNVTQGNAGIPVEPKLANMEGIPVLHVERLPEVSTPAHHVTKSSVLDVSGALGILEEIRNFKPSSSSSVNQKPNIDLASKLSDPNVVKQLRELLKSMMKKTGSVTSTTSTITPAPFETTTIPEMTTMTFPASSTGEYEEYIYMPTTGVYSHY